MVKLYNVTILLFKPTGFNTFQILSWKDVQTKIKVGVMMESGEIAQEMLNTDKNVVRKIH